MRQPSSYTYTKEAIQCQDIKQNHIFLIPLLEYTIVIETTVFTEFQVIEMKLVLICESVLTYFQRYLGS